MTLQEDIIRILTQARNDIQANMASKNVNASGRTSRGFKVVEYQGGVQLILSHEERTAPLATLEIGRPAGNVPGGFTRRIIKTGAFRGKPDVSNTFKAMLVRWGEEKGIAGFSWAQATGLGRKIAYKGTDRNRQHIDIYSTVAKDAQREIETDIRAAISTKVRTTILH